MQFDRDKFKAAVQYIIWRCRHRKEKLGATKLDKVLWLADTRAYALLRQPMMGATYIREKFGPVPREIMPVRTELEKQGIIRVRRDRLGRHEKYVFDYLAADEPNMSAFSGEEKQILNQVIELVCEGHTAGSISEKSHDYVWTIAEMGEVIPYHAIFVARITEPDDEDVRRLSERAKELGLD